MAPITEELGVAFLEVKELVQEAAKEFSMPWMAFLEAINNEEVC